MPANRLGRGSPRWESGGRPHQSFPASPLEEIPLTQPRNLAARAGRWSATHRKTAVLGWILFVVLATVIGGKVGQTTLEPAAMGNGESKRGDLIADKANFPEQTLEQVLIQGRGSVKSDDPEVTAAVMDVVGRLGQIRGVSDIESPLDAKHRPTRSPRTAGRSS